MCGNINYSVSLLKCSTHSCEQSGKFPHARIFLLQNFNCYRFIFGIRLELRFNICDDRNRHHRTWLRNAHCHRKVIIAMAANFVLRSCRRPFTHRYSLPTLIAFKVIYYSVRPVTRRTGFDMSIKETAVPPVRVGRLNRPLAFPCLLSAK